MTSTDPRMRMQRCLMRVWLLAGWALLCGLSFAQAPKGFEAAAAAFQSGNLPETERLTRAALSHNPGDVYGLNLLAVALDGQKKYSEAEAVYLEALRKGRNATLLNNLANHYLSDGQKEKAKKFYQEALRLDSHHANAHYQLAVLELEERRPKEALAHLESLPHMERQKPAVVLLRAQALFDIGQPEAAHQTLVPLESLEGTDLSVAFSLGVLYYRQKLYREAVRTFETALGQSPGDFDILYNLGLAYYQAGQKERAAEVLERAVRVNNRSADALYHLAVVVSDLGQDEEATELLIRAREVDPGRPELSLLLGRECQKQQFWLDAADAYEAYLRVKPRDWDVRRELAIVYGRLRYFEQSLAQMDRYVDARPKDSEGFFLRGLIAWHLKRSDAAAENFRRTLALNPHKAEAWSRLGEIAREKNDLDEAARCYRQALRSQPDEVNALYGLGQVLNTREQYREAVPLLRRAIEVRSDEPAPHYQLGIAYRRMGQADLSRGELEKFQELRRTSEGKKYLRTGLVAYVREGMKLSESERQARELEYLERAAAIKAGDAAILARLLDACLAVGNKEKAQKTIQKLLSADAAGHATLTVGEILARHGDYEAAMPYFRQAAKHEAENFAAQTNLAEAQFHMGYYDSALDLLAPLKPLPGDAEYHLLRATVLDRLQRFNEALAAYQQAIRAQPNQESPYLELGLFFVNHQAYGAALEDFRAAQKVLPQSLKLALAEAIVLNLAGRREESYTKLLAIEGRWPEQDWPYLLAGISAYTAYRFEDSRREFEKAAALESTNPLTYYYLALIDSESPQSDAKETLRWAEMAVAGDSNFAQAHLLLGKLYKRLGRNDEARKSLEQAIRLQPNLADAHYLLGRIYAQQGDSARADAETRESERWHREVHQVSPDKENIMRLLVQAEPARQ